MKIFRRSVRQLLIEILYTVLTPVSVTVLLFALVPRCPLWLNLALSTCCMMLMGWFEIAEQSIRLEWDADILRYYKRNRLVRTIPLNEYVVRQRQTIIRNSTQNLWLDFHSPETDKKEFAIDCMPLGEQNFLELTYLITLR